jgi:sterol desaturase/sphingolipid hydroxylase (fatty acid hydroxylase superfamily)
LLLTDFVYYWVHRFMHMRHVWRIHKWHHSPTYMYWLAGTRGSLLNVCLVFYFFALTDGLLFDATRGRLVAFLLIFSALQNDWMHLNVRWGSRWIEWFVITPRYHHIHHSNDPAHYEKNLASLFPIYDRLFGTYFDPDKVPTISKFGIGEPAQTRMVFGI